MIPAPRPAPAPETRRESRVAGQPGAGMDLLPPSRRPGDPSYAPARIDAASAGGAWSPVSRAPARSPGVCPLWRDSCTRSPGGALPRLAHAVGEHPPPRRDHPARGPPALL